MSAGRRGALRAGLPVRDEESPIHNTGMRMLLAAYVLLALGLPGAGPARAELDPAAAVDAVAGAQEDAAAAEERLRDADAERVALLEEVAELRRRAALARANGDALARQLDAVEARRGSLEAQIAEARATRRAIVPLMERMAAALPDVVEADLPYRQEARRARAEAAAATLADPERTVGERWQALLAAYGAEREAGRTLEAYQAEVPLPGGPRTVDLLRVGRLALLYRSPDGARAGYWDRTEGAWKAWPEGGHWIRRGLQIARRQRAPELLAVPVPAPGPASREAGP